MGFYRKPAEEVVPSYVEIIHRGPDLYHTNATDSLNSSVVVRQQNGQLTYIPTEQFALTSSNVFFGNQTINGDLDVNGNIRVSTLVSASILYQSGSTKFGNSIDDTHTFTGILNISNSINLTGSIYFATGSTKANLATGELAWDDTDGTLELGLKGGQTRLQIGQETLIRVVNKSGGNLTAAGYNVVKISAAQGQRLAINLAVANSDANSVDTIGLVTEDIAVNQEGFVTTFGMVNNINTTGQLQGETWNDGDLLFLSPFVSGSLTNIKPQAPNHLVVMGYVVYSHQNNGKIFVKVDNGYEIDELHNVRILTGSLKDAHTNNGGSTLYYSSSVWTNNDNVRLVQSTMVLASVSSSLNFANDTAAAAGGIPLGGLYRNGNVIQIRIV